MFDFFKKKKTPTEEELKVTPTAEIKAAYYKQDNTTVVDATGTDDEKVELIANAIISTAHGHDVPAIFVISKVVEAVTKIQENCKIAGYTEKINDEI